MINYTRTNLNKIIEILIETGYVVRFEKGNFQSGYAIVDDKKIIIINKFFDIESRINTLLELIDKVDVDSRILSPKSKSFHRKLVKDGLILNTSIIKFKDEEE